MKRAALGFLLLLASTAAVVLLAELAVRVLRPGLAVGPLSWSNPFWTHDPVLGWFHRPGEKGIFSGDGFSHGVSINSLGFRDVERPLPPAGGTGRRIAVLGDSFAWGHGVEDREILTRLMEEILEGAQVWNLGVSGYSTDQELLLLRRTVALIRPDVVVVMVCRNDPAANTTRRAGAYSKPRFTPRDGGLELTGVPVARPSASARALARWRGRSALLNGLAFMAERAGLLARGPGGRDEQRRILRLLLDGLLRESRQAGAALVVAIVPSAPHVHRPGTGSGEAWIHRTLARWSGEREALLVDLTPGLRKRCSERGERACYYPRDRHWNARGHEVAARVLAGALGAVTAAPPHSM